MRGFLRSRRGPFVVLLTATWLAAGCGGDDAFDIEEPGADAGARASGEPAPEAGRTDATTADDPFDATATPLDAAPDGRPLDAASDADGALFVQPFVTDGPVNAILHVGSSWYLGGGFSRVTTYPTNDLLSLDGTGTPAGCFRAPSFTGYEGGVMVQVGDALYIGGWTRAANAGGVIKLDLRSCAVDTSFHTPDTATVEAMATDGTSLFVSYGIGVEGQPSVGGLVKLDLDTGAPDATFTPSASSCYGSTLPLLWANGALYVGGGFTSPGPMATWHLCKLDALTGALDPTFNPTNAGFDQPVRALAAAGTSLYVGGQFSEYGNVAGSAAGLAKLDLTTGALDTSFGPANSNRSGCGTTSNGVSFMGPCSSGVISYPVIYSLAVAGTSLLVGGEFDQYRGAPAGNIAKIDLVSGELDTTFDPPSPNGFDYEVDALTPSGANLYVGGWFTSYRGGTGNAFSLAKLDLRTGAQDTSFLPADSDVNGLGGLGPTVEQILVVGDQVILGGSFNTYGGHFTNGVAKLDDVTYQVDERFQPFPLPFTGGGPAGGPTEYLWGNVAGLAANADGLYISGQFSGPMTGLAKVDLQTGAMDPTFASPLSGEQAAMALAVSATSLYSEAPRPSGPMLKVDATSGQVDPTFGQAVDGGSQVVLSGGATSIAVADESVYVGGTFWDGASGPWISVAKLSAATGALDATFAPPSAASFSGDAGASRYAINAITVSGSSVYVGGLFATYGAGSANNIAKLDRTTGALDTTFSPPGANGFDQPVQTLAIHDGALYAGGTFTTYRGSVPTSYLAKLDATTGVAFPGYGSAAAQFPDATAVTAIGVSDTALLSSTALLPNVYPLYSPLTPLVP